MTGPIAGANKITSVRIPVIVPRFCGGIKVNITFITSGSIKPVPEPWMIRPARTSGKTGAIPARKVPAVNNVIADRNNCLVVKRCIKNAVIGTAMPIMSIYPVDSHWAVFAEMPKSSMIFGKATFMTVSLIRARKFPTIKMAIIMKEPFLACSICISHPL